MVSYVKKPQSERKEYVRFDIDVHGLKQLLWESQWNES